MEDGEGIELEGGKIPKFKVKVSHEAKLKELLRNLTSIEVKLCSDASKDFVKLLRGDAGGELLREYVLTSSKCSELLQAWKLRHGKPGLSYILALISAILSHPDGKYEPNNMERIALSRALDKFAHVIIEEKLEDIYKELNSKEAKQQNASLLLLGSIVRRGSGLASDVAKNFDFKLPIFPKLAEYKKKQLEMKRKHSTRQSFIGFSMSFLEVGKPGLLRWVLQQKEMYSGVLRGLGNDDDETIVYVLSTLRDRILTPESMVPPGLRSVLFGSVTLDQLINISGRGSGGIAVETAHSVLSMVCTDPSNGLMPDLERHPNPLRGNTKRLLDVMKKLKATDVDYHRDLLLGIVSGRASFGSAYLDEFPYNLEDHASPIWLAAVSLAANLVSSVHTGLSFGFLDSHTQNPLSFENADVQSIIKCIGPRPFTRLVINKGLLHSDFLVKHGTLRLLLESLKLLDSFIGAIESRYSSSNQTTHTLASLKQDVQNEVRILLPDPQVLLSLLSSLNGYYKTLDSSRKRAADSETPLDYNVAGIKKLKSDDTNTDVDILVSGISSSPTSTLPESSGVLGTNDVVEWDRDDHVNVVEEIWGLHQCSMLAVELKDSETHFHSKLLDAFKIYHRTMPAVLKGSFDFFKVIPSDPLSLPTILQQSLLSLLIEHIGWSPGFGAPTKTPPPMYKHLCPFINLLLYSPTRDIKDQAHVLAKVAMLSTGAFDKNPWEIDTWFLFIPGYDFVEDEGVEVFQKLSPVIVSFLCDAVSTVGNNLFRYSDLLRDHTNQLKGFEDRSPEFSPLIICVIEKCQRLLSSESGTFTLPEKTMISLYACNTIRYLLQTQVEAELLSSLIIKMFSERFGDCCSLVDDVYRDLCEWRPLRNLVLLSRSICSRQTCTISSIAPKTSLPDNSFFSTLGEVKRILRNGHGGGSIELIKAFSFSMVCTSPAEILQNFPSILSVSRNFHGVPLSLLFSIFSLEQSFLGDVAKLWPELFFNGLSLFQEEIICTRDVDDSEHSASVAFSFFLKRAPFYVLFPAIIGIATPYLLEHTKLQDLLVAKLSNLTNDQFIFSLRLVLFWVHQIRSCYRIEPLGELEQLSEVCFLFVERMLAQVFLLKPGSLTTHHIHEVVETILCHPTVAESLECPLGSCKEFRETIFENSLENFLGLTRHGVHKMDRHVLNLLTTACNHLLAYFDSQESTYEVDECANEQIVKVFKALIQRLFSIYKDLLGRWIRTKNVGSIVPTLHALLTLIRFISPFELLHLVHWMFCTIDMTELTDTPSKSSLAVGLHIAGVAFEMLSVYFHRQCRKEVANDLFWRLEEKSFDGDLFEEIYFRVSEIATRFELDGADLCLLQAVNAAYSCKYVSHQCVRFGMVMSRVIIRTPINVLSHCIHKVNMTKAKLLFFLTEMSPLHLSLFGRLFSDMMSMLLKENMIEETGGSLSDEDFMMFLPVALSYLNSTSLKFGEHYKHFRTIPSFYMRIILDGFVNWKSYVSKDMFEVDYGEFSPSTAEELLNLVNGSLLVQSIRMLQYCFTLCGNSVKLKKRLKIFDSICSPNSAYDELLDCDFDTVKAYSLNQSLNFVSRVVAKISFCRKLLFLEDDQDQEGERDTKKLSLSVGSNKEDLSRTRFLNILVRAWQLLVKNFPLICDDSGELKSRDCLFFKILEDYILRSIYELTMKMRNDLIQLQSLPFLEQLVRSSLLHRFDDPMTLKNLRGILISLSDGKFSCILFLQLLLAHSQFAPAIHSLSRSSGCSQFGVIFRPMSGILRSLVFPHTNRTIDGGENNVQVLEVIKLLRTLFHFTAKQSVLDSEKDIGINSRELLLLLLSSYGATLSDIDLEIYNLMHEIESIDESKSGNIAEMDYLWGSAALKVRKEREHGQGVLSDDVGDNKAGDEWRRSQFRENIPIDPKLCAATVLYFPYYRTTVVDGNLCLNKIQQDSSEDTLEKQFINVEKVQIYDPVFILRFSIHSLSMGYIEPMEFASLGLLAVAFVSISSPDNEIRKLGYEALGRFKTSLEKCQRRKDVMRLKLLLTYLQNSVEEQWQRIPSITALFIAEASLILLDTSHDHYSTINKLLTRSPGVNMKCVPLFHDFFWSSSVHFKTDRLWVLRLLYAGLNLEDDAQVYIRNSIFETLLSFYASPLSDNESQDLILQVVKKSIKLHKMARYLVEHCNLISWLSTVISFFCAKQWQDQKSSPLTRLHAVLEIVSDVISSRNTIEWLQRYALEQLSELSSHVYKLLAGAGAGGIKLRKENVDLAIRILQTLVSTLKISQKRKMFQPHFTLSVEGLFHLYQAIDVCDKARYSPVAEFGLRAVLMSNPPVTIFHMAPEKLLKFIVWVSLTAVQSDSQRALQQQEFRHCSTTLFEEDQSEDSLVSKLLRWLTASVIHGRISLKSNDRHSSNFLERLELKTLQSFVEHLQNGCLENNRSGFGSEEILATAIFYLQQLLGMNCSVLPSVVSALSLLLLSGLDFSLGHEYPVASLWTRIRCPVEANPAWRWSFYQPWKDLNANISDSEKMDELHACQTLLLIFANLLGKKRLDFQVLSHQELENSGVFKWERSILEAEL